MTSVGKTSNNEFVAIFSGYFQGSNSTEFKVWTFDGWMDSMIEGHNIADLHVYDHFITKDGHLFVYCGVESQMMVLLYNFAKRVWTTLQPMKHTFYQHKCQSIAHDSNMKRFIFIVYLRYWVLSCKNYPN